MQHAPGTALAPAPPDPLSDEQICARLCGGDARALDLLVARYYGPIIRYCYRRTGNRQLAEDLAQDVFLRLLTYRGAPPAHFRSWLYTIAGNRLRDHFRSGCSRRTEPLPDEAAPAARAALGADPARLSQVEQRHDLAAAVRRLPPGLQTLLALRFAHDLSLEEIAARSRLPLGTVKSRLHRALRALRPLVGAA